MSNKMDRLFKDKLAEDTLQPSARAWEKVEAHLGKKNKMVVWRVAAGVVLLGVLTFAGLNWNKDEGRKEVAKKTEVKTQKPEDGNQETGDRSQETGDRRVMPVPPVMDQKQLPKRITKEQKAIEEPAAVDKDVQLMEQVAIVEQPTTSDQQPIANNQQPITNNQQPTTKGITLTYSLPPIKKEEPAVAQAEVKKTGLERVLEIAREVKNGDSPMAELREAKDDILALDFRKDKKQKH